MASFKYKNMQQFVKQTIHPYIVNVVLLIKDAFKHIAQLHQDVADTNKYIKTKVEPRINTVDRIVGLDNLVQKDSKGNIIKDENGLPILVSDFNDKKDNHETRLQNLETVVGMDNVDLNNFTATTDNHEVRLDEHDKDIEELQNQIKDANKDISANKVNIKNNADAIAVLQNNSNTHISNTSNPHRVAYTQLVDVYVSTLPPGSNTTYTVWDQVLQ